MIARHVPLADIAILLSAVVLLNVAQGADTTKFTYDSHGRLTGVNSNRGAGNITTVSYSYDAAGNRLGFTVAGSASNGVVTITPQSVVSNQNAYGVALGVTLAGTPTPTGTVTFSENGVYLGSMFLVAGQASIILEGFALGTHRITASYSGDASNAASSFEFTLKVQNLSWLPAVLELLLTN